MIERNTKLLSIQVIRAIAFILIFLSHVELFSTGPIGVSLFLVLSGFCMSYNYLDKLDKTPKPGLKNNIIFAWNKIKKLYPLHFITLFCVALVIVGGLILHKAPAVEIIEQGVYFVANAILLQSWIPYRDGYFSFNAVAWYLSTSAFSYFFFPCVFKAIQSKDKKRIVRLLIVTLSLMILVASFFEICLHNYDVSRELIKWVVYICPLYRAGDFIVGLVAGYVFVSVSKRLDSWLHTIIQVIVIALLIVQVFAYSNVLRSASNWTLSLFWLPGSVLIVYLFAVNKGFVSKFLSKSKLLVWIGDISGEAFLIHQICIKAAEYLSDNKWIVALLSFPATILFTVIWRWLYKHFMVKLFAKIKS